MVNLFVFSVLSLVILIISWRTVFNIQTHGFYRFFAWLCMAWLFATNYKFWFINSFSFEQIISWILLVYSAYLVIFGLLLIKIKGKPSPERDEKNLFGFEKTTRLVDTGVFKHTRHPLYASLIFVTWAMYLKNPTYLLLLLSLISSILLYITSKYDEKECIKYFGKSYQEYMRQTKMFIPFVF